MEHGDLCPGVSSGKGRVLRDQRQPGSPPFFPQGADCDQRGPTGQRGDTRPCREVLHRWSRRRLPAGGVRQPASRPSVRRVGTHLRHGRPHQGDRRAATGHPVEERKGHAYPALLPHPPGLREGRNRLQGLHVHSRTEPQRHPDHRRYRGRQRPAERKALHSSHLRDGRCHERGQCPLLSLPPSPACAEKMPFRIRHGARSSRSMCRQ